MGKEDRENLSGRFKFNPQHMPQDGQTRGEHPSCLMFYAETEGTARPQACKCICIVPYQALKEDMQGMYHQWRYRKSSLRNATWSLQWSHTQTSGKHIWNIAVVVTPPREERKSWREIRRRSKKNVRMSKTEQECKIPLGRVELENTRETPWVTCSPNGRGKALFGTRIIVTDLP